jgi:hypothetical protein
VKSGEHFSRFTFSFSLFLPFCLTEGTQFGTAVAIRAATNFTALGTKISFAHDAVFSL